MTTTSANVDSTPWIKRRYRPEWDEDAVFYLWLHAPRVVAVEHRPLIAWLLEHADVEVVCDPERAEPNGDQRAVVWAFAATSGDCVHYIAVKRQVSRMLGRELTGEIVRDLLGYRLERAVPYTFALRDLRDLRSGGWGVTMPPWYCDGTWLGRAILAEGR